MEVLPFSVDGCDYFIDMRQVREILGYDKASFSSGKPALVTGNVNLRGTVVPIIDLRMLANAPWVEYDESTVVIIVALANGLAGLVADQVSDVTTPGAPGNPELALLDLDRLLPTASRAAAIVQRAC